MTADALADEVVEEDVHQLGQDAVDEDARCDVRLLDLEPFELLDGAGVLSFPLGIKSRMRGTQDSSR